MRGVLFIVSLTTILFLTGCSRLIIRDEDSSSTVAGKVALRTVSCLATICLSELALQGVKDREEQRIAENRYWQWYNGLSEAEKDRETARQNARQQALGMFMMGSGPALINGMNQNFQRMQIQPPPPPVQLQPVTPKSTQCTSYMMGHQVITNCQ